MAKIIENITKLFIYAPIYPLEINAAKALNGFFIAATNTSIAPNVLPAGGGILYAATIGTINTMAINNHSIPNNIKYFLFLLSAPSTL